MEKQRLACRTGKTSTVCVKRLTKFESYVILLTKGDDKMIKIKPKHNTQLLNDEQILGEIKKDKFFPTNCPYYFNKSDLELIIKTMLTEDE